MRNDNDWLAVAEYVIEAVMVGEIDAVDMGDLLGDPDGWLTDSHSALADRVRGYEYRAGVGHQGAVAASDIEELRLRILLRESYPRRSDIIDDSDVPE